jgi:hypothetical protein
VSAQHSGAFFLCGTCLCVADAMCKACSRAHHSCRMHEGDLFGVSSFRRTIYRPHLTGIMFVMASLFCATVVKAVVG